MRTVFSVITDAEGGGDVEAERCVYQVSIEVSPGRQRVQDNEE